MKWKNTVRDYLPDHEKEVLISVNGVYYIAVFNSEEAQFHVRDEEAERRFPLDKHDIYWTELEQF